MSLDWNVSEVKNFETLCWIDNGDTDGDGEKLYDLNPVTKALTFATMSIGLDHISEENSDEFFIRLRMFEEALGTFNRKWPTTEERTKYGPGPRPVFITFEEVKQHIGLYTNASRMTQAQFHKRLVQNVRERATNDFRRESNA